jgi:hypothetical protein
MSEHDRLKGLIMDALNNAPKPLTNKSALDTAISVLTGKESDDFKNWFEVHGDWLVGRLNGT